MPVIDDAEERQSPLSRLYKRIESSELSAPKRALISVVLMCLLVSIVFAFGVPNPNMILVAGLVVCSSLFGNAGGISAAIIMVSYTLYFFSEGHGFTSFSPESLQKVVVTFIGITVTAVFTSTLRETERRDIRRLAYLTELLRGSNEELEEASTVDVLTGVRNRYSLRRDYDQIVMGGQELLVLMLDVDDFKGVNDTHGHEAGDELLERLGTTLTELYGKEHAYRYGGDEFLVITPVDRERLTGQLGELVARMQPIGISGGYVLGTPRTIGELRHMMHKADEALYASKRAGKGSILSGA